MDPLDGTTNFVHSYPFTCVSIGLAVQQQPVVGVVYNPILGELFYAAKGSGAFLNDKPISVSDTQGMRQPIQSAVQEASAVFRFRSRWAFGHTIGCIHHCTALI